MSGSHCWRTNRRWSSTVGCLRVGSIDKRRRVTAAAWEGVRPVGTCRGVTVRDKKQNAKAHHRSKTKRDGTTQQENKQKNDKRNEKNRKHLPCLLHTKIKNNTIDT